MTRVIDRDRSTSDSRLIPSGVSLVGPGEKDSKWETKNEDKENGLADPFRRPEVIKCKVRDLRKNPSDDSIGSGDTKDIAALQLSKQTHSRR